MSRRGIALISAVMMMSLALMLLGAFLQINRGHLWLLNASEGRQIAHSACQAGYEYVLYRLEHDRHWGENAFTGAVDGQGTELEVEEVVDTRTLKGRLQEATFEVDLENNLMRDAESEWGVPPHCCRLTIRGHFHGASKEVVTLLHVAPLFDSSALTRGRMVMHSDRFNVRSKDQWRNQIRAEQSIDIPECVSAARTQFLLPDSTSKDSKGMLWSKSDIFSNGTNITAANIPTANANTGGRIVPNAKQHFEIFDLQAESIVQPANSVAMRPGVYRFTKAMAHMTISARYGSGWGSEDQSLQRDQEIEVLEYYANPDDPLPTHVYRSESRMDDIQPPIPPDTGGWFPKSLSEVGISGLSIDYNKPGTETVPVTIGDRVALDSGEGKVMANLVSQDVTVAAGTSVNVDGSLSIESLRGTPPRLDLGATGERAAIIAEGSLNLSRAETKGVGTLVAKNGDVSLQPLGETFEVEVGDPLFGGLVLFAGGNVTLTNPSDDAGGQWDFKGLVYARNNFFFDAHGADARVEGTIVARAGNLTFESAGADVEFIYNPEYLKAMIKALPENRVQLERLYWRE